MNEMQNLLIRAEKYLDSANLLLNAGDWGITSRYWLLSLMKLHPFWRMPGLWLKPSPTGFERTVLYRKHNACPVCVPFGLKSAKTFSDGIRMSAL